MPEGIAKPMPWLPPDREKIAVLMPTRRPLHVDQRAAGVARIDGGVGLDEELVVGDADLRAREGRDDALRHRLADAERVADGEDEIADLERLAESPSGEDVEVGDVLELQDGEVGARIAQHDLRLEFAPVGEGDLHLGHVLDDVVVGDDEAGRSTMTPEPREVCVRPGGTEGVPWPPSPKKRRKNSSMPRRCARGARPASRRR